MLNWIKSLNKAQKRNIMLAIDALLVPFAMLFAFAALDMGGGIWENFRSIMLLLPYMIMAAIGISIWIGIADIQVSAYEAASVGLTAVHAIFLIIASMVVSDIAGLQLPMGLHMIFGVAFFCFAVASRAILLQIVLGVYRYASDRTRVLIYGAGTTGSQMVSALRGHETIQPVAFVDDNKGLHGLRVQRLPVFPTVNIAKVVDENQIDRVLLAVPSLSRPKQAQIARRLEKMGLEVQTLPSFSQLIGEEALVDKLTPVSARSFLGREEVDHVLGEARNSYQGKVVLISGAGGSIGSELCRQVIDCRPSKLILFELSELALYEIDMELRSVIEHEAMEIELIPVLGSVTDSRQVRKLLATHEVKVVLHAAAYKHVPLVEANPLTGLVNNVFGTQTLAEQAAKAGVERFMLISSDKAVRPTNVMGASKRLAELVIQDMAYRLEDNSGTIFSMVRFGNVLGSSGSVVPLFQEQLRRGGPLTVTDKGVERYFMTVQEAVKLVLQACAISKGAEVFVLDMGEPVPIFQLARQVIESAGYDVRDADNPEGDIEIEITGLRPGEKMSEELTISSDLLGTVYPKIFMTHENGLSQIEIATALRSLREAFVASDEEMAREVVRRWVEGFQSFAPKVEVS
ncbi:polysaccharide biosynthesis protein [Sulfitobacter donghicola]|uniref:Nucleotide sugar epimerase n=1 Tax=Sulfitobacter donghicola DSW-25 = KCTC 12864 = JCM 14565 TaxID=1300350 RepID=A0A073IML4_9RHOB|nr:nucleoside-diphosphate sugar epimerase/dehydratase [Sulfitobacter donghicola]KEJ90741.1 nucleotide sugar epimerase [Sulfitobacter donghicola DSW-25 = KCTC 12864 = JCM 14565]